MFLNYLQKGRPGLFVCAVMHSITNIVCIYVKPPVVDKVLCFLFVFLSGHFSEPDPPAYIQFSCHRDPHSPNPRTLSKVHLPQ